MPMLKVIEVLAESKKSWEDAAEVAVSTAKSVRGIRSLNVENLSATVEKGKITHYRLNAKISFVLE